MPSYFPENNSARPTDTEVRSLQKINDLLAGGSSIINVDIAGSVAVSNLPSLGTSGDFKGAANETSFAPTNVLTENSTGYVLARAYQGGTWDFNLPTGASTSALQTTGNNTLTSILNKLPNQITNSVPVANTSTIIYDNGSSLSPNWTITQQGSGDLIQVEGNSVAASYITISKDPFTQNTQTILDFNTTYVAPYHLMLGVSASQQAVGQEEIIETVSTDASIPTYTPVAIASVSQTTTTLTVTTATAHGLQVGSSISISGMADSRLNYPALNVAFIGSATQFVCTSGPTGTIQSLTVSVTPPASTAFVNLRPRLGYAPHGSSMIADASADTTMGFYVRNGVNEVQPYSLVGTTQQTGIGGSWTSVPLASAGYSINLSNPRIFDVVHDAMGLSWMDRSVDSSTALASSRAIFTRTVPDPTKTYKLRLRATNNASLTRPVAKIVSITKTASTTATVTTSAPHGLTTSDYILLYNVRDQTNFPNLTTGTVVASTPTSTSFTVVIGPSATATSYGGYVSRQSGGAAQPGARSVENPQSISRTNNLVTVATNATTGTPWSGVVVGDIVELYGFFDTTGTAINVDGPYRVLNPISTGGSIGQIVLEPIGSTPTGANIASTNCGGGIIKRTDLRIHSVRVKQYREITIEHNGSGIGKFDRANAMPVTITYGSAVETIAAPSTSYGHSFNNTRGNSRTINPVAGSTSGVVPLRTGTSTTTASPQNIGTLIFSNMANEARWVKLFNATASTVPQPGVTGADMDIMVPANSTISLPFGWAGARFSSGLTALVTTAPGKYNYTSTGLGQTGLITDATVVSGGTGYTAGDILTVVGGTGTAATFRVATVTSGVITLVGIATPGNYTTLPSNPVSVTGGTGSGATFNLESSDVIMNVVST